MPRQIQIQFRPPNTPPPRPRVLVLGQSLHALAMGLLQDPDLQLQWSAPKGFIQALQRGPDSVVFPAKHAERVQRLTAQHSPRSTTIAVGARNLFGAQTQGADAVFCVSERQERLFWTPENVACLASGLKQGISHFNKEPVQARRDELIFNIQGTVSPLQRTWHSGKNAIVLKRTDAGIFCDTSPEGRSVLQVIFRDTEKRIFGGLTHPLREVSWFLEQQSAAHLKIAIEAPCHMLDCLLLLANAERAEEIHSLNPTLFWLIVDAMGRSEISLVQATQWIAEKQRTVLGILLGLGGKATRGQCKTAKRICFWEGLDLRAFENIRRLLKDESYRKAWAQWMTIPFGLFASGNTDLAASLWLRSASRPIGLTCPKDLLLYLETLQMVEQFGAQKHLLHECINREEVEGFHDRWVGAMNEQNAHQRELTRTFPPPPIPPIPGIQHINNGKDLFNESKKMHHCVAIYGDSTARGYHAIYAMKAPERATIRLYKTDRGRWNLGEIKGPFNREVLPATLGVVLQWVRPFQDP